MGLSWASATRTTVTTARLLRARCVSGPVDEPAIRTVDGRWGTRRELTELPATEQRRLLADREVSATELLDAHLEPHRRRQPGGQRDHRPRPRRRPRRGPRPSTTPSPAATTPARSPGWSRRTRTSPRPPTSRRRTARRCSPGSARPPTACSSPACGRPARSPSARPTRPSSAPARTRSTRVHGVTRNPWDLGRSAGGSSGGAAVALACGMVAIADGSDMGGSLRNPAAWNNVVGFRPTPRVVPRRRSRQPVDRRWRVEGPMGRTVADVALLLGVLAAPDAARSRCTARSSVPARLDPPDRPLRVAWSRDIGGAADRPRPRSPCSTPSARRSRRSGWDVVDDEPDLAAPTSASGRCGRGSRRPARRPGSARRPTQVKATIRDEIRRGSELTAAAGRRGLRPPRRAVAAQRRVLHPLRPARRPGHPGRAVPGRVGVPDRDRRPPADARTSTGWRSCYRVTVLGVPGAVAAGRLRRRRPAGRRSSSSARPGADVDVLRAAAALEAASGHGRAGRRAVARSADEPFVPLADRVAGFGDRLAIVDPGRVVVVRRRRRRRRRARRRARTARYDAGDRVAILARRATTSSSRCSPAGTPGRSPCRSTRSTPTPSCATRSSDSGAAAVIASDAPPRASPTRVAAAGGLDVVDVDATGRGPRGARRRRPSSRR